MTLSLSFPVLACSGADTDYGVFKVGNVYAGFKLIDKSFVEDINSYTFEFEHVKTGAKTFAIKNNDDNKSFGIGFKTLPETSNGIPHILEHSVLCGSEKYPAKDPFTEMIKRSHQTFLNAMTYPDKTIYPVSSQNEKDYFNLMDVYMDSTLNPLLREETFKQEGWRYEINPETGELMYNGVVYNEMKGVYSNTFSIVYDTIQKGLFPDTVYGVDSGGDPQVIPELTYEEFKAFHKKYYHPSNSYIYFYGDADLMEELTFVNDNYLADFDREEIDAEIKMQEPFDAPKEITAMMPMSEGQGEGNKGILSVSHTIGKVTDRELKYSCGLLMSLLTGTDNAPLRKALMDTGIAKDVTYSTSFGVNQPYIIIMLIDADESKMDTFKEVYINTLKEVIENGFDDDYITSMYNQWDYSFREILNEPRRGVFYFTRLFFQWLYDSDPVDAVKINTLLGEIKSKMYDEGYFENIIDKYMINNPHTLYTKMIPDPDFMKKIEEASKDKLKKIQSSMTEEDITRIKTESEMLKAYQMEPDSEEVLKRLPKLSLDDISTEVIELPIKAVSENNPEILYSNTFSNEIAYFRMNFDLKNLNEKEFRFLSILDYIMMRLGTENSTADEFTEKINTYTGGIYSAFTRHEQYEGIKNEMLSVFAECTKDNYDKLEEILTELYNTVSFEDTDAIKGFIHEYKTWMEKSVSYSAIGFLMGRLYAYASDSYESSEYFDGIEAYSTILEAVELIENDPEAFKKLMYDIRNKVFTKDNFSASFTIEGEYKKGAEELIRDINDALPEDNYEDVTREFEPIPKNEAFIIPSRVQYCGISANLYDLGYENNGSMAVLTKYLDNSYLQDNIRVVGGAYGAFMGFNHHSGVFYIASYRDPNIKSTYETYDRIAEHLENLEMSDDEFESLIISATRNPLLSPKSTGNNAYNNYIYNYTDADRKKYREEILNTSIEDLRAYAELFRKISENSYRCTFGGESMLNSNSELFDTIKKPFE